MHVYLILTHFSQITALWGLHAYLFLTKIPPCTLIWACTKGNALLLFINNLPLHSNQGLWVLHPYFSGRIIPLHAYLGPTLLFFRRNFSSLHVYSGMHA